MKPNRSTFPLMAFVLGTAGFAVAQGHGPFQPVNLLNGQPLNGTYAAAYVQDYGNTNGWDQPPHEFREIQRQGFHDGVEGAKKDFDNHRMPDVNNREEYRHPKVSKADREDYREGFRRGYDAAMDHLLGRPGPR
jgi:hypothetical protein